MKNKAVLILFLFCLTRLYSETNTGDWQLGISGRVTIDILANKQTFLWYNWRFAISTSAAYLTKVNVDWHYMPSAHLDFVLMQEGIGTKDVDELRQELKKSFSRRANGFVCLTVHPVQVGLNNKGNTTDRNSFIGKPLYYFSDFTYLALKNPFHSSLSLGTTFAFKGLFGDRKARWFTGDGVLNYYNNCCKLVIFEPLYPI